MMLLFVSINTTSLKAEISIIDSLKHLLKTNIHDTTRVLTLSTLGRETEYYDTSLCRQSLESALNIAHKIKFNYGLGFAYYQLANLKVSCNADYEYAFLLYDSAKFYFEKVKDNSGLMGVALVYGGYSQINYMEGMLEESVANNISAIEVYNRVGDDAAKLEIAQQYVAIGQVYHRLKQFEKSIPYFKLALKIRHELNDTTSVQLTENYLSLAYDLTMDLKFEESRQVLDTVEYLLKINNVPALVMEYYEILGSVQYKKQNFKSAVQYYFKSLSEAEKTGSANNVMIKKFMIAQAFEMGQEFDKAIVYYQFCLDYLKVSKDDNFLKHIYKKITNCYEGVGKTKEALQYLKLYNEINDSLNNMQVAKSVNELDVKYQSLQKEKQISELEKTKQIQQLTIRQRSNWLYFTIASIVALLLIVFLFLRNAQRKNIVIAQKEKLHEQQVTQLQQDKRIAAVSGILKTQEEERCRFAKDLHDGLGGLLSGVKLSLSGMKGNQIINEENAVLFQKSITQLDVAINEMRRVAHNMMPEALVKFGLTEAVESLCESISETGSFKVHFEKINFNERLSSDQEVVVFRMIQELINNSIKHAKCKNIIVQISRHSNKVQFLVEDDGKGFEPELLQKSKGMGYQNLDNRVEYLKGSMSIKSSTGNGTSVMIEFEAA